MRNFDLTPLYRSSIGFDHLFSLLDSASRTDNANGYPPYNVELVDEDEYRITMAVAGFEDAELSIEVKENTLTVTGEKVADETQRNYLHQGIAARNFERRFQLADHVKVVNANLANGLLDVELKREIPEAMKPRKVAINTVVTKDKLIEGRAA